MASLNDDIALAVLTYRDFITVIKCRVVSNQFKRVIDNEVSFEKLDFSNLSFRKRCSIKDSTITDEFAHLFRRASIIILDGTRIGRNGTTKLVTYYIKELHVERCPNLDPAMLIQDAGEKRWLSSCLDPVRIYVNYQSIYFQDLLTILKPLH